MIVKKWEVVEGEEQWVEREEHGWERIARLAAADVGKVTHFVKDKITGKEVALTGKDYWRRAAALERSAPPRKPAKTPVKDPVVRKFEYKDGKLTERRVKQSALIAEKAAAKAALLIKNKLVYEGILKRTAKEKAERIRKAAEGKIKIGVKHEFQLNKVVLAMVAIGAAILYFMRRKK